MVEPESSKNLFNEIDKLVHRFDPNSLAARLRFPDGMIFNMDDAGLKKYPPFKIDIQCETTAATYSVMDPMVPGKALNYVLFTHNLEFSPSGSKYYTYGFAIRALSGNGTKWVQGDEIPVNELSNPAVFDDQSNALQNAAFIRSEPGQTPSLDNYSSSISTSIGANVGFFGDTLTGGVSVDVIFSSSHTWSTPSVACHDTSISDRVSKEFNTNTDDARSSNFETTVQELVSLPDDGIGTRSPDDPTAIHRLFEIRIWASVPGDNGGDTLLVQNIKRQIIKVPAPPLPADYKS